MKIVISGGLGYVGGRLSKFLVDQGNEVTALSRQAGSLHDMTWPDRLTILHPDDLFYHPEKLKGTDAFIHLAALNEHDCVKYPEQAIEVNIIKTLQWLDHAYQSGVQKFMYFSTAHVYGKPLVGYYDENSPTKPAHPYAITHKCAEDYVLMYRAEKKMNNFVVRLTNSFGGPAFPTADRWTLLVNDLCRSAVQTGTMTLLSDGLQHRDFVCLQDVCRGVYHLLAFPNVEEETGIFNLGRGASKSVWHLALEIQKLAKDFLGREIKLVRQQPIDTPGNIEVQIAIEKIGNTGFLPLDPVSDEILSTLSFFDKNYNAQ